MSKTTKEDVFKVEVEFDIAPEFSELISISEEQLKFSKLKAIPKANNLVDFVFIRL